MTQPRLALFISDYGQGGVERMLVNTASAIARRGIPVSLVVTTETLQFAGALNPDVELVRLSPSGVVRQLSQWLWEARPAATISGKLQDDAILIRARDAAGVSTRVYFRVGNPLGHRVRARHRSSLRRWWEIGKLRRLYARADGYIAVSRGNADDLVESLGVERGRVLTLPNPVITEDLENRTLTRPDHPWYRPDEPPVVLAVGGLRQQKDFPTLVCAFANVRKHMDCRLLILGEGRQRARLLALGEDLGLGDSFALNGWVEDPYPYMKFASVFTLTSIWEGFGNVLVEAAALKTPLVATDCPYGPREILEAGRYGRLVPVGDEVALATAIEQTIQDPPPADVTARAAEPYRADSSARQYIAALGLR